LLIIISDNHHLLTNNSLQNLSLSIILRNGIFDLFLTLYERLIHHLNRKQVIKKEHHEIVLSFYTNLKIAVLVPGQQFFDNCFEKDFVLFFVNARLKEVHHDRKNFFYKVVHVFIIALEHKVDANIFELACAETHTRKICFETNLLLDLFLNDIPED